MKTAIIAIGDELMTGAVNDENSAWLADRLFELGAGDALHLAVEDDLEAIKDAFEIAGLRAEAVIVTGGLGPTADDLTREAACRFAGVPLIENQNALDRLQLMFRVINREMTENNRKQAMIPEGAELIENPIGTAPGFAISMGKAVYYFLPGVPRECRLMAEQSVLPALARKLAGESFRARLFRTFGMTESQLDQTLAGLDLPAGVRLCYRAVFPEIHLKLIAKARSAEEAEHALEAAAGQVRSRVGSVIYSEDGRGLEEVVLELLRERKLRMATAESCTGGLIAKRITDAPGSSEVFDRGYVTYSNRAKTELLGVEPALIEEHGAVSAQTALAMARGAKERAGVDLAIAVTGIAGPTGGTPDKPVGTVHIAIADQDGTWERRFIFTRAERTFTRELTAQAALEIIRRRILGIHELER